MTGLIGWMLFQCDPVWGGGLEEEHGEAARRWSVDGVCGASISSSLSKRVDEGLIDSLSSVNAALSIIRDQNLLSEYSKSNENYHNLEI